MIQLRVRTEFSFGKTFAALDKVVARLKAIGCTAAGIVDEASTWGHVKWFEACTAAGIQPLLGVELIVSDDDRAARMWFLAKNTTGLSELYRFSSKAHQQPFAALRGTFPRLYRTDVAEGMSENILKFAGDVTDGDWLASFGAIVDLSPASRLLNLKKKALAEEHGLLLVSTSDNFFPAPEDKSVFELVVRGGMKPSPMFLLPELENQDVAAMIAEECAGLALPKAPMIRFEGDLEAVCRAGIAHRRLKWTEEYEARLQYELELIRSKDFESYFLMVADMCLYAKEHMLVGPSRGSAAGSLVCYTARITEIDPISAKLFFERFIDVSRSDLPDIDLDFPDDKRAMVFDYMAQKYGPGNTAKIGTMATYRPRSALIEVCKALNIPPQATGAVKVAMIERGQADSRANNCLQDTLETTAPGRALLSQYPQVAAAGLLEGHATHTGTHAAGLLVCNDSIENYATVDALGIAHVEKHSAEVLGLLKIDVLGLTTLGIIEDSGIKLDWYALPFDDPATYEVFNADRMCGIFQFSGNALRSFTKTFVGGRRITNILEIDALTALARPGPFGAGITNKYLERAAGKPYESIHPLVESFMSETYGLPLYQEQTMAIVREIGKFDWAETTFIRKAISKRQGKEFFDRMWPRFIEGAASQGVDETEARAIWELINAMGAWQMNKAHTFSYAVISYWTAYLKAHHPLEFAAANLRSAKDEDSAVELLREMAKEGITFKPFDLALSEEVWTAKDGVLIGGFTALKGFGASKAKKFVEARNAGTMTKKQREEIDKADNVFSDIFPMRTKYGSMYDDPEAHNISGPLSLIGDLDGETVEQGGNFAFLGEIVSKSARNRNEEVLLKKRHGQKESGQLEFVDLRLRDDTGTIGARIGVRDYLRLGKEIMEGVPIGAHLMVRARIIKGIRFGFISNLKRIDQE